MSRDNNFHLNIRLVRRIPTAILVFIIVIIQVYSIDDVQGNTPQNLKKVLAINSQQQASTNSQTIPKDVFIDQLLAANSNLVSASNKPTIIATTTNQFQLQNYLLNQQNNNNTSKLRQVSSDQNNQNVTNVPRRAIVSMSSSSSTDNNNSNNISSLPLLQQPASFGSLNLNRNNYSISNVRQKWRQMERSLGENLHQLAGNLKQTLDEIAPPSISATCRSSLYEYVEALKEQKLWANKMFDASAKLPSGLLEGTLTELGNFDQCLSINSYLTETQTTSSEQQQLRSKQQQQQSSTIKGQYCSLQIKPYLTPRPRLHTVCQRLPQLSSSNNQSSWRLLSQQSHQFHYVGLRLGICTPNKCSKLDIQQILSSYLAKYELLGQVKSCQTGGASDEFVSTTTTATTKEFGLDLVQLSIVSTFGVLLVLVAIGTLIDYLSQVKGKTHIRNKKIELENPPFSGSKLPSEGQLETVFPKVSSKLDCKIVSPSARRYDRISVGGGAKRWQYQVYRGAFPRCALHGSQVGEEEIPCELSGFDCTDECESDLKLQKNPLVAHLIPSDIKGYNMLLTDASNSRTSNQTTSDDNKSEEAWIAKLESNEIESKLATKNTIFTSNEREQEREEEVTEVVTSSDIFRLFLICFSLRKNLKDISKLNLNSNHNNNNNSRENVMGDVKVIHGIRTLTIMWIIFAHTIGLVNPEMMNNLFSLAQNSCSSRFLQALLNATLAVNTFFMISGLVTVLGFARKCTSVLPLLMSNCKIQTPQSPVATEIPNKNSTKEVAASKQVIKKDNYHNELEVSSTDSSSIISSLSSLASSNKCINARRSSNNTVVVPSKDSQILSKCSTKKSKIHNKSSKTETTIQLDSTTTTTKNNYQPFTWPNDFKPLTWLIMRYLRLTPAYTAIIGASVVLPALGSGPFWQESINQMGTICRRNWWINLTYLNNFIETDKLCLIHSWYLSNDWQFFSLTLILFAIFYKSKKFALLIVILLIISTSAATFAITVSNDFPPTIVTTSPAIAERWQFIYTLYYKPWPHLSSYLIGLITGYLIVIKDRIYLSKFCRFSIWILFSLVALTLLNSIYPWNMGIPVEPLLAGLHSATFRTLWATCCAWLIFALVTKPQNPLAKFLSWQGFQITSRLTYCAYLVHPLIIYYHFGTLRERLDSSIYGQFHRYTATLLTTYLFALILSLVVESPSIQLQHFLSYLTTPKSRRNQTKSSSEFCNDEDVYDELTTGKRRNSSSATTTTAFTATTTTNTNSSWSATSSFSDQNSDVSLVTGNGNGNAKHSETFKALSLGGASVFHSSNHKDVILSLSSSPSSSSLSSPPPAPPLSHVIHLSSKNLINCKNITSNTNQQQQQQQQEASQLIQSCSSSSSCIEKPFSGGELLKRKKPQEFAQSSISALDADFQHKLAQAISRGFRIRSQIANGTAKKGQVSATSYRNNISRRPQSVALGVPESNLRQQQEQLSRTNHQRDMNELNKYRELSTFAPSNKHKQQTSNKLQQQQQQIATGKKDVSNNERHKSHDLSMFTEPTQARLIELPSHHRYNTNIGANLNEILLMKERLLSKSQSQIDVKTVGNK